MPWIVPRRGRDVGVVGRGRGWRQQDKVGSLSRWPAHTAENIYSKIELRDGKKKTPGSHVPVIMFMIIISRQINT